MCILKSKFEAEKPVSCSVEMVTTQVADEQFVNKQFFLSLEKLDVSASIIIPPEMIFTSPDNHPSCV